MTRAERIEEAARAVLGAEDALRNATKRQAIRDADASLTYYLGGLRAALAAPPSPGGPEPAGTCTECRGPVYHRPGSPGEFDHECPAPSPGGEPGAPPAGTGEEQP